MNLSKLNQLQKIPLQDTNEAMKYSITSLALQQNNTEKQIQIQLDESIENQRMERKKNALEDLYDISNIHNVDGEDGFEQSINCGQNKHNDGTNMKIDQSNKFQKLIFRIKLKFMGQRMLSRTPSRMFKNMKSKQFKQIDDKAYSTIFEKKKENNKQSILSNIKNRRMISRQQSILSNYYFSCIETCTSCIRINIWNNSLQSTLNLIDKKLPVMDPTSIEKIIWDIISIFLIIIYMFQIPLQITFLSQRNMPIYQTLVYSVPIFVLIDILISINTGLYEKGKLIRKRYTLIKNNLSKVIVPNIIIFFCFNVYIFSENLIQMNQPQIRWKDILLLSLFQKVQSLGYTLRKFEETSILTKKQKNIIALLNLIFKIVFIAHIISCIWILIAEYEESIGEKKTWLKLDTYQDTQWSQLYINAYYFTTVTMITVGFGDYLPITNLEKTISILLMIFSCGVFAYSMNTIGSILQNFNEDEVRISQNMAIINSYMHKKNVNKKTQSAIREYLEYYWKEESDRNQESEKKIINLLSESLKETIQFEAKNVVFRQSTIFRNNFSESVRQKMVPLIKEHRATPDEIICAEGLDDECSIYFIEKGSVEVFIDVSQNASNIQFKQIATIEKGQSFGEISFFSGKSRIMNIRSKEFTTLLIVKRDDFISLVKSYPDDYERFCTIKDSINLYDNVQLLNIPCLSCGQLGHLMRYCPQIHFVPNEVKIRQYFMHSPPQERKQIERQLNHKYNCLINTQEVKYNAERLQSYYEIGDYFSSVQLDQDDDEDIRNSFMGNNKFHTQINYDKNEFPIDNKTISSPRAQQQYNQQKSIDRNIQLEENRESIIIDESHNSKSPFYRNQKSILFQRETDTNKIKSITFIKEDEEQDEANQYNLFINSFNSSQFLQNNRNDDEDFRVKQESNLSKSILMNRELSYKLSRTNEKKNMKQKKTVDYSFSKQNPSNLNKLISMKKTRNGLDMQQSNLILNQIIQLLTNNDVSNYTCSESPTAILTKSPILQKRFALFQELSSDRKQNFQKQQSNSNLTYSINQRLLNSKQKFVIEDNSLFFEGFDCAKNYMYYYPLNNLENQLHLMSLSIEKKRQAMTRNHFDNIKEIKKLNTFRQKSKKKNLSNLSIYSSTCRNIPINNLNEPVITASPSQPIEEIDKRKSKFYQTIGNESQSCRNEISFMQKSMLTSKNQTDKFINKKSKRKSEYKQNNETGLQNQEESYDKSNSSFQQQNKLDLEGVLSQNVSITTYKKMGLNCAENHSQEKNIYPQEENSMTHSSFMKFLNSQSLIPLEHELEGINTYQGQEEQNNYNKNTDSPNLANSIGNRKLPIIKTKGLNNMNYLIQEIPIQELSTKQLQINQEKLNKCDVETDLDKNSPTVQGKTNKINNFNYTQSIFLKKVKKVGL